MKKITKFYADWCQPCKAMTPIFNELKAEMPEVVFFETNIEEDGVVENFSLMGVPTFILSEDGTEVNRKVGLMTKEELKQFIAG